MKLIVGLGNPGDRYMSTRRNIGFRIIDVIANNVNIKVKVKKKKSILGQGQFENHDIMLLKPQTFMNLSGEAVLYIASFLRVGASDIIIIHDDYRLPYGKVELRQGFEESRIMHLGLESIAKELKSESFLRIQVGVGPINIPKSKLTIDKVEEFCMSDFKLEETLKIINIINAAEAAVRSVLIQDIEDVLSRYKIEKNTR